MRYVHRQTERAGVSFLQAHPAVTCPDNNLINTLGSTFHDARTTGFGGWISSFVLLEGATQSEAKAAFLVSIFWAAVTIGRCVVSCFVCCVWGHMHRTTERCEFRLSLLC